MNHKELASQPPTSNDNAVSSTDQSSYVSPTLTLFPDYIDTVLTGTVPMPPSP